MAMPKECGAEGFRSPRRDESLEGRKQCDDAQKRMGQGSGECELESLVEKAAVVFEGMHGRAKPMREPKEEP
jgi:hypothetical protein